MIVYKITNLLNGKIYIGKDASNNPNYFGSGLHIKSAIKKYGKENFIKETLEVCDSLEKLAEAEIKWISKLDARNLEIGYNISIGGEGVMKARKHSAETKKLMAQRKKSFYENNEHYRIKLTKEGKKVKCPGQSASLSKTHMKKRKEFLDRHNFIFLQLDKFSGELIREWRNLEEIMDEMGSVFSYQLLRTIARNKTNVSSGSKWLAAGAISLNRSK
jgi:hypothetical protein